MRFNILICLVLVSCGRYTDPTFKPYLKAFKMAAIERGKGKEWGHDLGVGIEFGRLRSEEVLGACNMFTGQITINPDRWHSSSEITREMLIFHELGHCVLGRDHITDNRISLMTVSKPNDWFLKLFKNVLLDELFNE